MGLFNSIIWGSSNGGMELVAEGTYSINSSTAIIFSDVSESIFSNLRAGDYIFIVGNNISNPSSSNNYYIIEASGVVGSVPNTSGSESYSFVYGYVIWKNYMGTQTKVVLGNSFQSTIRYQSQYSRTIFVIPNSAEYTGTQVFNGSYDYVLLCRT